MPFGTAVMAYGFGNTLFRYLVPICLTHDCIQIPDEAVHELEELPDDETEEVDADVADEVLHSGLRHGSSSGILNLF